MIATRMLGLLLAGFSGTVGAQSVYKCRDAADAIVYQSEVCSGTTEKRWIVDPEVNVGPSAERSAADRSIERDRQSLQASNPVSRQRATGSARANHRRAAAPSACERERKARAAAHERRGVHWSFDDASRWDGRVFKACR